MRLMLGMTMGLAFTGLSACGPSEESLRNTTRDLLLVGCRNAPADQRELLAQRGINVDQYCTCAADRTVRALTTDQLKQMSNSPGDVPGADAAAAQCMSEIMQGAGAPGNTAAGNASQSTPVAPETGAPSAEEAEPVGRNEAGGE